MRLASTKFIRNLKWLSYRYAYNCDFQVVVDIPVAYVRSESSTPNEDEYQNTVENATHQKDKCQDDLKDGVNNGTFIIVA